MSTIPADDPQRNLTVAKTTDPNLNHIALAGNIYTILLTGNDTAGRYCLIEMRILPGGGPPPHRHDFEESFTVLEGEIEATFRGEKSIVGMGQVINIPANAPHQFKNKTDKPARLLCICAPAGQEQFFLEVAVPVAAGTTEPPALDAAAQQEMRAKSEALASKYKTEFLKEA